MRFCERDSSGTTEAVSAKRETAKVMERIARRERGQSPREAARPNPCYKINCAKYTPNK
jgi:hypothetical protein